MLVQNSGSLHFQNWPTQEKRKTIKVVEGFCLKIVWCSAKSKSKLTHLLGVLQRNTIIYQGHNYNTLLDDRHRPNNKGTLKRSIAFWISPSNFNSFILETCQDTQRTKMFETVKMNFPRSHCIWVLIRTLVCSLENTTYS